MPLDKNKYELQREVEYCAGKSWSASEFARVGHDRIGCNIFPFWLATHHVGSE